MKSYKKKSDSVLGVIISLFLLIALVLIVLSVLASFDVIYKSVIEINIYIYWSIVVILSCFGIIIFWVSIEEIIQQKKEKLYNYKVITKDGGKFITNDWNFIKDENIKKIYVRKNLFFWKDTKWYPKGETK